MISKGTVKVGSSFAFSSDPIVKLPLSHIPMESSAEAEYAAFEEKVKRTVYIDNLSHQVNENVIKSALNQFGNVTNVEFIPNYLEPKTIPLCALVEMENPKQAREIVLEISNFPFMMSGMPRPVRARSAEIEMFAERPRKPGRKIQCTWLSPKDPGFEVAKKMKNLTRKHASESSFLLKQQIAEEEKLSNQQSETLKANYKKYELIDGVLGDGTAKRLGRQYNINLHDAS